MAQRREGRKRAEKEAIVTSKTEKQTSHLFDEEENSSLFSKQEERIRTSGAICRQRLEENIGKRLQQTVRKDRRL